MVGAGLRITHRQCTSAETRPQMRSFCVFGLTANPKSAAASSALAFPSDATKAVAGAILISRPISWAEELSRNVVAPRTKSSIPGSLANRYYNTFSFSLYFSLISGIARCLAAVGSPPRSWLGRPQAGVALLQQLSQQNGFAQEMISALEERAIWSRYGL